MNIFEQLKRDEGFTPVPVQDTEGNWEIGYGFDALSRDEADAVLVIKVQKVRNELTQALGFYPGLDEVRQGVLENMCYNLGIGRLLGFSHTIERLLAQDWAGAADEMLQSRWAGEVGERAQRLAEQMRNGVWV